MFSEKEKGSLQVNVDGELIVQIVTTRRLEIGGKIEPPFRCIDGGKKEQHSRRYGLGTVRGMKVEKSPT